MIRVLFDPALNCEPRIPQTEFVTSLKANDFITAESQKNRQIDRENVERYLRPFVASQWSSELPSFRSIGIETRAGCNASCKFCPVSRQADSRPAGELEIGLLEKLAAELGKLSFSGTIQLFGNNEPLQDPRIVRLVDLFRSRCPAAEIKLLTNGMLITVDLAESLFVAGLSVLTINNYTDGKRLIRPVRELISNAIRFEYNDVRVSVRKLDQVLTTRANRAPNKRISPASSGGGFCALPFIDIQIDYRGLATGCCFDSHSELIIGDIRLSTLSELWLNDAYMSLRANLLACNRSAVVPCRGCDFDGFGDPFQDPKRRLTRDDLPYLRAHEG